MGKSKTFESKIINLTRQSLEKDVYRTESKYSTIGSAELVWLGELASRSEEGKARICCHQSHDDVIQEMFIAIREDSYLPPHKHPYKNESIHVMTGEANLVYFNQHGEVEDVLNLGQEDEMFCRIPENIFHTLIIRSNYFAFHEVIPGPFHSDQTIHASWAPSDYKSLLAIDYLRTLKERVKQWTTKGGSNR